MHPPLHRPHPDCQEVSKFASYILSLTLSLFIVFCYQAILDLVQCHDDNKYMKFFGACNDAKVLLDKCFKQEKDRVRKENLVNINKLSSTYL